MHDDDTTKQIMPDATLQVNPAITTESSQSQKASLVVLAGWEIGREFDLSRPETILGRSPEADYQLAAPSMSRQHAKVVRKDEAGRCTFEVIDLHSLNGTRVNNHPVTTSRLNHGDRVQMGDVVFRFLVADAVDAQFYREIHRRIHYDALTGLMEMDSFRRHLEEAISRGDSTAPFTLAMTDLDGLKRVNDTFGHLAGRMVVREMGAMIRQCLRVQDTGGLYGGDEAIILYRGAGLPEAQAIAERLRRTIESRVFQQDNHTFSVTISQGLAEWPRHATTAEQLIAAADQALYAAKHAGRNCIRSAGS